MLYEIIQDNFMCFILCILFIVYVITDRSFDNSIKSYFLSVIGIILVLLVFDDLELIQSKLPYPTFSRRVYATIGYALRPSVAMIMTGVLVRADNYKKILKYPMYFFAPFILNASIAILSIWFDLIFVHDSNNQFARGPFNFIPFIVGMFYVTIIVYTSMVKLKIRKKGESAVVFMLAILSIVGTLMESLFGFVGILTDVCAISTVLYYLYLHVMIYTIDGLTNAYSRRIFFLDVAKLNRNKVCIVSMDLNRLKEINDHNGHQKGDEALSTFSKVILQNIPKHCNLYRMGGDEFSLICKYQSYEQMNTIMLKAEQELNQLNYSFAFGICKFEYGQNIDEINNLVDQRMYEMKRAMKQERK